MNVGLKLNPLPGLQNCLIGHPSSNRLIILSECESQLLDLDVTPPFSVATPLHKARVHATTENEIIVAIRHQSIIVTSPTKSFFHTHVFRFEERAIAAEHDSEHFSVRIVVSGYDGVYVTSLNLCTGIFDEVRVLPGTAGRKMICVTIKGDSIAAANLDGRVAVWRHCHKLQGATAIVEPPSSIVLGDRVTDIAIHQRRLVVGWWSGSVVLYNEHACPVWITHTQVSVANFGMTSGTFLVIQDPFIVASHGSGSITWIDVEKGTAATRKLQKEVKGFCSAGGRLFIWSYDKGIELVFLLSSQELASLSEPMENLHESLMPG